MHRHPEEKPDALLRTETCLGYVQVALTCGEGDVRDSQDDTAPSGTYRFSGQLHSMENKNISKRSNYMKEEANSQQQKQIR